MCIRDRYEDARCGEGNPAQWGKEQRRKGRIGEGKRDIAIAANEVVLGVEVAAKPGPTLTVNIEVNVVVGGEIAGEKRRDIDEPPKGHEGR